MRLGQYRHADGGAPWAGVSLDGGTVVRLDEAGFAAGVDLPRRTVDLLGTRRWRDRVDLVTDHARETGEGTHERDALERAAPVTGPQKVVAVGLNYVEHIEESGNERPDEPVLFAKYPSAITGPGDPIRWRTDVTDMVDFETELVAVVGERAREVPVADALDHVAGYTVGNDVSARDLQDRDGQWVRGKSLDTFAPLGPELVTADEVGDPHDMALWSAVNGERMQESTTANLIFGVDELVSVCSQAFTLEPGDLIFTGTPPGVGKFREPPVLLEDGDEVTVGVEGLGELTNPCESR